MQINTRFDVGDEVVFIYDDAVYKRHIRNIEIQILRANSPIIIYHFIDPKKRDGYTLHKCEPEVAKTVEELVSIIQVV